MSFLKSNSNRIALIRIHQLGLYLDPAGSYFNISQELTIILTTASKNPMLLPIKFHWIKLLILNVHYQLKIVDLYRKTNSERDN